MYGIFIVTDGVVMLFSTTGNIEDARKEMNDALENGHQTAFIIRLEGIAER